jgi:hypothetical protein
MLKKNPVNEIINGIAHRQSYSSALAVKVESVVDAKKFYSQKEKLKATTAAIVLKEQPNFSVFKNSFSRV